MCRGTNGEPVPVHVYFFLDEASGAKTRSLTELVRPTILWCKLTKPALALKVLVCVCMADLRPGAHTQTS